MLIVKADDRQIAGTPFISKATVKKGAGTDPTSCALGASQRGARRRVFGATESGIHPARSVASWQPLKTRSPVIDRHQHYNTSDSRVPDVWRR